MPETEYISLVDAKRRTSTDKRAELLAPYTRAISDLSADKAGVMTAGSGETIQAVRRRLGTAARQMGVALIITRQDDKVYFWNDGPRKRGRPKKLP